MDKNRAVLSGILRCSIAVLAVGGQTLSLLLTLLAIPVIYSFLDDLGVIASRVFGRRSKPVEGSTSPNAADAALSNAETATDHTVAQPVG